MTPFIKKLTIKGFKAFRDTTFDLGPLEVIVGANGSGKTSLFEFLRFIRDAIDREIPPEIIKGSIGQELFHDPGNPEFQSTIEVDNLPPEETSVTFESSVRGPVGRVAVLNDSITSGIQKIGEHSLVLRAYSHPTLLKYIDQTSPEQAWHFKQHLLNTRYYQSARLNLDRIKNPTVAEQEPTLHEDCGNLSSVLMYFMSEHPDIFEELQVHLRSVVPGFKGLGVKVYGRGEVLAQWKEDSIDSALSLADVSDGILRLICWFALCLHPKPPKLVSIDEPDNGIHPRALDVLAALLEKASLRTQILVATHSSYFLSRFDLDHIAVMKKTNGEALYFKPKDSKTLTTVLADFERSEIEAMHRSDELEALL